MLPATLLAIAIGMPLTELEGDGNMYVFAHLGSWSDPFCQEGRTTYFGLAEFLEGVVLSFTVHELFSGESVLARALHISPVALFYLHLKSFRK